MRTIREIQKKKERLQKLIKAAEKTGNKHLEEKYIRYIEIIDWVLYDSTPIQSRSIWTDDSM